MNVCGRACDATGLSFFGQLISSGLIICFRVTVASTYKSIYAHPMGGWEASSEGFSAALWVFYETQQIINN